MNVDSVKAGKSIYSGSTSGLPGRDLNIGVPLGVEEIEGSPMMPPKLAGLVTTFFDLFHSYAPYIIIQVGGSTRLNLIIIFKAVDTL